MHSGGRNDCLQWKTPESLARHTGKRADEQQRQGTIKKRKRSDDDACGICLDIMDHDSTDVIELKSCRHSFHIDCLRSCSDQWLNLCPMCRKRYNPRREWKARLP